MGETPHILVVDDERGIREPLAHYLEKHEMRVSLAKDAREARKLLDIAAIDLVVLDIMMPGEDGLSLARHLRDATAVPVILLTALAEETDRIVGLEVGADDYVGKPFNPRELLARIRAVLRRVNSLPPHPRAAPRGEMRFAGWRLDTGRREIAGADGVGVPLSTAEFDLLSAFLAHPNRVLSRDQLLDLTRGRRAEAFDRAIDNQVSRLRKKLESDPKNPQIIKTVWGGGYMFVARIESG